MTRHIGTTLQEMGRAGRATLDGVPAGRDVDARSGASVEVDVGGGEISVGGGAEAEGVSRSFVNRLLRLTIPPLDIQEAILEGRQPKEDNARTVDAFNVERVG